MNAKTKKKKRSPLEMALVWGGIVILVIVLVIELSAQMSYSKALTALESKFEKSNSTNPLLVQDALASVSRKPESSDDPNRSTSELYTWQWFSFFRTYKITISVRKSDEVVIELEAGE